MGIRLGIAGKSAFIDVQQDDGEKIRLYAYREKLLSVLNGQDKDGYVYFNTEEDIKKWKGKGKK